MNPHLGPPGSLLVSTLYSLGWSRYGRGQVYAVLYQGQDSKTKTQTTRDKDELCRACWHYPILRNADLQLSRAQLPGPLTQHMQLRWYLFCLFHVVPFWLMGCGTATLDSSARTERSTYCTICISPSCDTAILRCDTGRVRSTYCTVLDCSAQYYALLTFASFLSACPF